MESLNRKYFKQREKKGECKGIIHYHRKKDLGQFQME